MPALTVATAALALAKMNVELAHDRLAWNFFLILLLNVRFADLVAAVGTSSRELGFVNFIDVLGRRPMTVFAVPRPALASWGFGMLLGRLLGKGCRLAFARALTLFEELAKLLDLGVTPLQGGFQLGQPLLQQQAIRA
jgi:hypothetical protein